MSSSVGDTAAFFANKKKKKKAPFKLNANLIDSSTVTSAVHVDAPALTTNQPDASMTAGIGKMTIEDGSMTFNNDRSDFLGADEQWDDAVIVTPGANASAASSAIRKGPRSLTNNNYPDGGAGQGTSGGGLLLDYKSSIPKHCAKDSIVEKIRVEETKAQLAAAREGMEREGQKLKDEQERIAQEVLAKQQQQVALSSLSSTGVAKWVPSRLSASSSSSAFMAKRAGTGRFGSGGNLDVQNEELFPDLSLAAKISEQKEKEQHVAFKISKKTPVGGGATWASKPPSSSTLSHPSPALGVSNSTPLPVQPPVSASINAPGNEIPAPTITNESPSVLPTPTPPETLLEPKPEPEPDAELQRDSKDDSGNAGKIPCETTSIEFPKIVPKKKKKKDLATFKPGG